MGMVRAVQITILFCNPAICAILAWALLGEGIGLLTILGCLASLCGVAFVSQPPFIFGNAAGAPGVVLWNAWAVRVLWLEFIA